MPDTQTSPDSAVTEKKARKLPRWLWWALGGGAVGVLLIAAAWFLVGPKVWTDGGTIRIADRETKVRDVIWTRPQPLEGFSSDEQVYEPSISPDGTELYFVRGKAGRQARIFVSLRRHNAWTKPVPVDAVNGPFDALGPRVSPDGRFLLFYSDRPGGLGGYDIWAAPRTSSGWGKPFNLGPSVNSEFNEFNPDPTPDGRHLVFATNRTAARREQKEAWRSTIRETVSSNYDLWIADADQAAQALANVQAMAAPTTEPAPATRPTTAPATQPAEEPAPPSMLAFHPAHEIAGINTDYTEGASCMSPAGDFLYFASNRPGGAGKFDIYRCRAHGDQFGPAENVGPPINSAENEADPALAYNGFRMVFSSDRPGADGRYHLLISDSREVYPEHQGRPLPHLGWSWWLLIGSLLVLIPLLMFLRGWEDHRLSILQRCLILSLLVHAIITFILSFVVVTQKVTQYVRREMQMEVAVSLKEAAGAEESLAIRSQAGGGGNDLPVSPPASANLQAARAESEIVPSPAPAQVDVPAGARVPASAMTIGVAAPASAAPQRDPVAAKAAATASEVLDVKLPAMQPVSQPEAAPRMQIAGPQIGKATDSSMSVPGPQSVERGTLPVAAAKSSELADVPAAPASGAQFASATDSIKAAAAASPTGAVETAAPRASTGRLADAEAAVKATGAAGPMLARAATDSPAGPTHADAGLNLGVPKAAPTSSGSLMDAQILPQSRGVLLASAAAPGAGNPAAGIQGPQVGSASSGAGPVAAAEPSSRRGSSADAIAQAPLQASANLGPAGAGPGRIEVNAAPARGTSTAMDLAVAPVRDTAGLAGNHGTELGGGRAMAQAGAAIQGPQVSMSPVGSNSARAQAAEPALAASGAIAGGPTTRPIELAAGGATAAGGPPQLEIKGRATGGPSTGSSAKLAVANVAGSPIAGSAMKSAAQPDVKVDGGTEGRATLAGLAPAPGAKLAEKPASSASGQGSVAASILKQSDVAGESPGGATRFLDANLPPASSGQSSSLASSLAPARIGMAVAPLQGTASAPAPTGEIAGPRVTGPGMIVGAKVQAAEKAPQVATASGAVAASAPLSGESRTAGAPSGIELKSVPLQASAKSAREIKGIAPDDLHGAPAQLASAQITPDLDVGPLGNLHGPGNSNAPETPFMRAPAQRKPLLEEFGGTKQSEDAVARALAYLARMQEPDGRWTRVDDDQVGVRRPQSHHDMACTGFAVLAFLAQNHTPDKPGPYRDTVSRAIDFLIAQQDDDGDLRGPERFRGGGSDAANMYDQGIATYALAECAIMTHDPRIIDAATKGARFIVAAQNRESGGWRYSPNEFGDSSVFGWQIMALHSAEQVGFEIPPQTIDGAKRYIESCAEGKGGLLAGYQPHTGATPAMTAELVFCRMLLDMPLDDDGIDEVTRFLARDPPDPRNANLYYWYYASLSMLHMRNPLWKDWNILTRESLIRTQRRNGSWGNDNQWGARGGRIFTTAIATLTLEVYYRYLPLRKPPETQEHAGPPIQ